MGFTPKQQKLFDAIRKMKADGLDDTRIREFVDFAVKKDPELSLEPQEAAPQPKVSLAPPKPTQMRGALGAIEAQAEERGLPKPSTVPTGTMPDITKQESNLGYMGRSLKEMGKSAVRGFEQMQTYMNPFTEEGRMMGEVARMGMADETRAQQKELKQDFPKLSNKSATDVFRDPSDLDAWTAATAQILPTAIAAITAPVTGGASAAALGGTYFASSLSDNYAMGRELGLTDNQATAYGTIMGSIEAAAESLGLDALTKIPKSWISREVKEAAKKYGKEGVEQGVKAVMGKIAALAAKRGVGVAQGVVREGTEEGLTSLGQSGTQLAFDAATGSRTFDPSGTIDDVTGEVLSRAGEAFLGGAIGGGIFGGIQGIDTRDDIDPVPAIATTEERQASFVPPDVPPANPLDNVPPTTPPVDDTPMAAMTEATDEAEDALTALADDLSQDNVVATEVAEELPLTEAQKRAKETLEGYKSVGAFDEGQLGLMQPLIEQLEDIADEVTQLDKVTKADKLGLLKEANTAKKKGIEKRKKEIEAELKRIASTPTVVTPVAPVSPVEEDVAVGDDELLGMADDLPAVEEEPVVTHVEPVVEVETPAVEAPVAEPVVKAPVEVVTPQVEAPVTEAKAEAMPKEVVEESKDFTDGKDLQDVFNKSKEKYGEKEGAKYNEAANRLVNPNKNKIVEVRSNGVVVKKGDKFMLLPFTNTDANYKKWKLSSTQLDVTDQFNQKPNTDEKANEEPLLEGLRDGGQQDQGRQESPELRPQEAQGQVTAADFAAIEAKGQAGRKARQALSERVGKDVVADMTRITAKFESIITALEKDGKIRKQCP